MMTVVENVVGPCRAPARAYDPDRLPFYVARAHAERSAAAADLARQAAQALRDLFGAPAAPPRPGRC